LLFEEVLVGIIRGWYLEVQCSKAAARRGSVINCGGSEGRMPWCGQQKADPEVGFVGK
jgi:hypothetical protein